MEEQKQQVSLNDAFTRAQTEKINLEIEKLKQHGKWDDWITKYIPLITTLVAVGGLVFSFWQAQKSQNKEREDRYLNETLMRQEQEKERANRIRSQIRADKEQILEYDKISIARFAFVLDDLNSLVGQLPEGDPETQNITKLLVDLAWEFRFNEEKEINFDVQALRRWPHYREFWKTNAPAHRDLLYRYLQAMRRIYAQDPLCIKNLDLDEDKGVYVSRHENKACEEGFFPILLFGFQEHLQAIKETNDSGLLEKEISEFSELTGNSLYAQRLPQILEAHARRLPRRTNDETGTK